MGGSKEFNLSHKISNAMKTSNNQEQRVRRFMTPRDEAISRCLHSLIHTLSCREGEECRAHGCLKMKRVVEHTKTCTKKNNSPKCPICTQLMSLCFYHAKICRANVCHVPFCRIMKRKLQSLNELFAQKQSIQSMKPVYQFPIPPLNLPTSLQHHHSASAATPPPPLQQQPSVVVADRRERDLNSEPKPKRIRLDESNNSVSGDQNNIEAQNVISNVYNQLPIFG